MSDTCRGCGAPLTFAPHLITGSRLPLTPITPAMLGRGIMAEAPKGAVFRLDAHGRAEPVEGARRGQLAAAGVTLWLNHWANCAARDQFRKPRGRR